MQLSVTTQTYQHLIVQPSVPSLFGAGPHFNTDTRAEADSERWELAHQLAPQLLQRVGEDGAAAGIPGVLDSNFAARLVFNFLSTGGGRKKGDGEPKSKRTKRNPFGGFLFSASCIL